MGLIILDEIHLLGGDRGPILEVIVSRMRYIASETDSLIRFVGLSTALANAKLVFLFLYPTVYFPDITHCPLVMFLPFVF